MKTPDKLNIHAAFDGTNRFVAPVYQRYYVWGNEALQVLLDDIENAEDPTSEQFIGAIVVQDFGRKGGSLSPNEYLIIDGQQRLTTIFLIICGISWSYIKANKIDDAKTIIQSYLSFNAGTYSGMPKLLPTIQDRKQLFDILKTEMSCIDWNFSTDGTDNSSNRRNISNQWENIKKYFSEKFFNSSGKLITKNINLFRQKIFNHVTFIQVTLDARDDANTVFSKLNYDGEKLSLSDLVRNDVISRIKARDKKTIDKFYDEIWRPFETQFPNASFDQYITVYSFIRFNGSISKTRAFPELQKSWFDKSPEKIVKEMNEYADLYSALYDYKDTNGISGDIGERVWRISLMPKTTVTWPYILELLNSFRAKKVAKNQVIDCLSIVESFLVRRAIVGLEPTGLHAVFKGLWGKAGADKNKLKQKIITGTIRFPDDKAIKDALLNEDMYSRKITKYLIIQRELSFNKQNNYDNAIEDFTIEHVLPQSYSPEWESSFTREEHKALYNNIGNLLPLTGKQNKKVKDLVWAKKREVFQGSNWKITQKASSSKDWNKEKIISRCKDFSAWAIEEWPGIS
jgi:uncharacterized protein with ParB-like and HNH nuclease domain